MERMDRVRRLAGTVWAVGGLLAMLIWSLTGPRDRAGVITWIVTAFVIAAVAARASSARIASWWGARLAAAAIGVLLLGAVGDRFGLLGAPGDPGVSWGDWAHFRVETAELVPWSNLVQPAAVAATIAELALGGLLVAGFWWRWTGKASAGLFFVYLVTMVPGLGAGSVLEYGVPVLIGGSLLASARGPHPGRRCGRRHNGASTLGAQRVEEAATVGPPP